MSARTRAHTPKQDAPHVWARTVARAHAQGRILSVDDDEINHATIKVRSPHRHDCFG
jgi:hypothetical protein